MSTSIKIAIIGYGKMGKTIESLAIERGHTITHRISSSNKKELKAVSPATTDVAIEFTRPEVAFANLKHLLSARVPTVCGSTGWLDHFDDVTSVCRQNNTAFLYASNFSVGVNITFAVNQYLAQLISKQAGYRASIHEVHHTSKVDAPSGTAITLAKAIVDEHQDLQGWTKGPTDDSHQLPVTSDRIDPTPGTHQVTYQSEIDSISLTHSAHSRQGFALGAILAAEHIHDKRGIFTMQGVLQTQ